MTSPTEDRFRRSFDYEADVESVALARRDATEFVVGHFRSAEVEVGEDLRRLADRLALVVSELSTNAVVAAPGQWFRVGIVIDAPGDSTSTGSLAGSAPSTVTCRVTNPRSGEDDSPRVGAAPDTLAARGRGLVIVADLTDRTRVDQTPDTTTVTAELSFNGDG